MANQVRPWLVEPRTSAALRVRRSDWEPASQSHQGQRHAPQQKSGCTDAIFPCKPSRAESLARLGASMYERCRCLPTRERPPYFIPLPGNASVSSHDRLSASALVLVRYVEFLAVL